MKPRFTLKEHYDLGGKLSKMRSEAISIMIDIQKAYPLKVKSGQKTYYPSNSMQRAIDEIARLRSDMEEMLYLDLRNKPEHKRVEELASVPEKDFLKFYYGRD